jgi:hypothetical protein
VFVRLTAALTDVQREQLDALLVVQSGARMTTLATLRQPPRRPTPATFVALAEGLQHLEMQGHGRQAQIEIGHLEDGGLTLSGVPRQDGPPRRIGQGPEGDAHLIHGRQQEVRRPSRRRANAWKWLAQPPRQDCTRLTRRRGYLGTRSVPTCRLVQATTLR